MNENRAALSLIEQYPKDKYTLLVPIETVAKIAEIQSPVINVVKISTNLQDKEIYEQRKGYADKQGNIYQSQYALTKKGLGRLADAAGISQIVSEPVLPSVCQKCAQVNRASGKTINCNACGNKDVKYKVIISVPQLTGEKLLFTDHHEINVETAVTGMTIKQQEEFLKYRSAICEAKALNGAIRTALHIKGTYLLKEFEKPFIVAYLVPNLDDPDVKRAAISNMFESSKNLFGNNKINQIEQAEEIIIPDYNQEYEEIEEANLIDVIPATETEICSKEEERTSEFWCDCCGKEIHEKVWDYSVKNYGQPLCYQHQKEKGKV